jgi:G3E family GTPase
MSHSHAHEHVHAGIGTFVYRARRPFHPGRLLSFLRHLPVSRGLPSEDEDEARVSVPESTKSVMQRVLRSKGFIWCANSNLAAMFLSHAGTSVELSCLGRWWATLNRQQWPAEAVPTILEDYDDAGHNEEDQSCSSVGDRRQEIVFIGQSLGEIGNQRVIGDVLDQCLLDDTEWSTFRDRRSDESALCATFANPMQAKVMSY